MKKSAVLPTGGKHDQKLQQHTDSPSKKPYGFCCEPRKDKPLIDERPENDPALDYVALEAGGPNLKICFEELDRVQSTVSRKAPSTRSKSPRISLREDKFGNS
ncbi:hypothetical protein TSAR_002676 [Trichomalopsis sarcophagae]|uniref:Uncharacterized protein n=1 Tax=Trichomalopsis sarcophagae TaxID=543379 RepID=A0A232EWV5_9HYME|nr:hypothetical protein TSAR_002676 [Trichomalopsis sarcophagae]